MVCFAIEALVKAGVEDLILVTGGTHAGEFLRLLGNGREYGIHRLSYAYQERPGGIAEALTLAYHFVEEDQVVVMLADNLFERGLRCSVEAFGDQRCGARILLAPLSHPEHLKHLGVAKFDAEGRIERIVEKPEDPPSELAVTGVYFYDSSVWTVLPTLRPSGRGELEITDVNNHYIRASVMEYDVIDGFWGDAGESIDAYHAVNDLVRTYGANIDGARQ
jgi:glucose-1-phosphate thymidylyltransferase